MSAPANPAADQGSQLGRLASRRNYAAYLTNTDGFAYELVANETASATSKRGSSSWSIVEATAVEVSDEGKRRLWKIAHNLNPARCTQEPGPATPKRADLGG